MTCARSLLSEGVIAVAVRRIQTALWAGSAYGSGTMTAAGEGGRMSALPQHWCPNATGEVLDLARAFFLPKQLLLRQR